MTVVVSSLEASQAEVGERQKVGAVGAARLESMQAAGEEVRGVEHLIVDVVVYELVQLRCCDAAGWRHSDRMLFHEGRA